MPSPSAARMLGKILEIVFVFSISTSMSRLLMLRYQKGFNMAQSPGIHLWLVLWKAYDSLRKQAEQSIAAMGLNWSDFAVLEVLLHKGPLPVNTIGVKVMLT